MPSLGIKLSPQNCTIAELRAVWRIADEAGFDHLWAFDHFNPIFADAAGAVFEGMTLLAAMAEATVRVRIGLMVAANTKRLQRPHPPIWVGGAGEKLTLRVVAEHADVWNVIGPVEEVVRKASVLDQHCADIGRDPAEIRRSVQPRLDPADPAAMV